MDINLRNYQIEDTQAILDILNYNILHSTALYDYNVRTYEVQLAMLEDKVKKGFPIIIAEVNGAVAGFGMYGELRFKEAYKFTVEHSVYVSNDYQGKGIGKLLLKELIAAAKEQGIHTMIAVIDSENQNSVDFHEKFGFETVGLIKESGWKFERWLHSVFMQLILK